MQLFMSQNFNDALFNEEFINSLIFHGALLLASFLAFILFLVWRAYAHNKRSNISLRVKNKEIEAQNRRVKEAKEKAEGASMAKQNFLSNMSHEIRTPLNAIIGLSDILLNENPPKKYLEALNGIKYSGKHLLVLVNDILDITKIEEGKINIENASFDLKKLIKSVEQAFRFQANEKKLELRFDIDKNLPQHIIGDPVRLAQILNNLISNAIKFTKKGSVKVRIEEISREENKTKIEFNIKDSGIGISKEEEKLIFDRFEQAKSDTTRNFGGSGLGLTITKHLLELQGSGIELSSTPGKGSEFYFKITYTIDDSKLSEDQHEDHLAHEQLLKDLNVLLVEDNDLNLMVSRKLLSNLGIKITSAKDGLEAVTTFKQNEFDLVLMDLHMPVMDGYEATRQIKKYMQSMDRDVPVIALTADVMPETKDKIENCKMVGYILKPIDPKILKATILETIVANSNL